jgi:hypothetical protein
MRGHDTVTCNLGPYSRERILFPPPVFFAQSEQISDFGTNVMPIMNCNGYERIFYFLHTPDLN